MEVRVQHSKRASVKKVVGFAGAVALALFGPAPVVAQDAPPAMEILQRALGVWTSRPTPPQIVYDVDFHGKRKNSEFTRNVHVAYDASSRSYTAHVTSASGSEPLGVNAERQRLFPDETFGLVPRVRSGMGDAGGTSLQTLAVTRSIGRYPYDVSFAGTEEVQGRSAYHLRFSPRESAERYPVRDAWIDVESFDVLKIVAREVEHAGIVQVPFMLSVEYAPAGPYWLVEHGAAAATAHLVFFTLSAQGAATYVNYSFPVSLRTP